MIDRCLQHLPLWREPEAVIDQFGVARGQFILQMRRAAIQRQLLDATMGSMIDGAARRFVHAARFHADIAVLDQIEPADAMLAAIFVELLQQRRRAHRLAIDRDTVAAFEINRDIFGRIRRILGIVGPRINIVGHFFPRILKHLALRRGVQHVGVARKWRFPALVFRNRNLVLLGKFDQPGAAGQIPFAPGGDDLHIRVKPVIAQFEADLVIALAGCAMRHGVRVGQLGNLDLALGNQRACDRGAEQIEAFVERIGAHHRKDEILDKFLAQIVDEDMLRLDAEGFRNPACRPQFLALPQIGGKGHHLALIFLLQPLEDDAGIEAAGKGQNHTFNGIAHFIVFP